MIGLPEFDHAFVEVHDDEIEVRTKGEGRPIVFLHPGDGLMGAADALSRLATVGRVIVPSHPGFGASALPPAITTVDDLAYFYLDFLDALDLSDVVLLGASFGGWIAAQMAVKSTARIGALVLVDSLGIKIGDREARDIADMHAMDEDQVARLKYSNPEKFRPDYKSFSDEDLVTVAKNRETFTLFGWRPYMHDPKLRDRLRRIRIPTLVIWGEDDGIVSTQYGRSFSAQIKNASFEAISHAAHYPYIEQPSRFCDVISAFVGRH